MIRSVQQLREELHDAPDDMRVMAYVEGMLYPISNVLWLDGMCIVELGAGKGKYYGPRTRRSKAAQTIYKGTKDD